MMRRSTAQALHRIARLDERGAFGMINLFPDDWRAATLVGRIDLGHGPTPVVIRQGRVQDVSRVQPTVSSLLNHWDPGVRGTDLGDAEQLGLRPAWDAPAAAPRLLSPVDLHCVKAAGVTFAVSTIERVIEERARGDAAKAHEFRQTLKQRVGSDLQAIVPGSESAARLKSALIVDGLWSQYLEVAIGPDAEIFTKTPPLASVSSAPNASVSSAASRAASALPMLQTSEERPSGRGKSASGPLCRNRCHAVRWCGFAVRTCATSASW